ncbi:hypothetical protein RFM26_13755 [Mesorhizobium sp. VK23B]|uniref:Histone n=1 Tax=Mesorhizobium dulcispinae TaxID=3072316 RepID=A0ABU4XDJ5_9HYPH|nr:MULTISPECIES: hypothetical protein [unclassified Mesorhizobium]MDX8466753.1 hypothetical protein [Mesorhizobium sp. VK23B]MDX8472563.1 hypothetical protein [Mesorhizobium sp. VK23A]MDX8519630.1 hypothetical protein [Mesorhizobium sp. VK23D]
MATKTRKPAPAKSRASQSRTTQSTTADRSKDAKPTFGKAAPKKVVPGASHKVAAKAAKPHKPAAKSGPIRTVASVATGAVVATARLAASVLGRGGAKAK